MSEPLTLYGRIEMQEENFRQFMQSEILPINHFTDWMTWLNTLDMHGDISENELNKRLYQEKTVSAFLEKWVNDTYPFPGNTQMEYNSGSFTISSIYFSENYYEFIYFLNVLRQSEIYLMPNEEGLILIYDHFWAGGAKPVAMKIEQNKSEFISNISEEWLHQAQLFTAQKVKAFED